MNNITKDYIGVWGGRINLFASNALIHEARQTPINTLGVLAYGCRQKKFTSLAFKTTRFFSSFSKTVEAASFLKAAVLFFAKASASCVVQEATNAACSAAHRVRQSRNAEITHRTVVILGPTVQFTTAWV
jgi:hypothetical protein